MFTELDPHAERLRGIQLVGVAAALVGVVLLAGG